MSTFDGLTHYYSGQGVVMIAERTAAGRPAGLTAVGNVSALSIKVATSVLEHKESQSGQRAIDLRLTTEIKAELTMDLENFDAEALRLALRGDVTNYVAGTVVDEEVDAYLGKISPLEHMKVAAVVVSAGVTPLVLYTDEDTPWDYKLNSEAGSLLFNDGTVQEADALKAHPASLNSPIARSA